MPSARKSSAYFASPVTLATTSCGRKSCPSSLCAMVDLRAAGGTHDGVQVIVVGAATAQVPRHGMPRLFTRRFRVLLQQRHGGDHLAGRAEAALRTELVNECLLHRVQFAIGAAQPLDGHDLAVAH